MKKARQFMLLALIITLALLILVGCKKEDVISHVALKDNDQNTAIELAVGEFDCSAYTLVVTYESGNTEEIPVTEDMIPDTDKVKLYQIGDHDITVSYGEYEYTFKVSVKRSSFGDLSFPENTVFTYNGEAHVVEVDGNIPANAIVTYPGGNSFINAGTYDVTAIVSCEGYVTERLSTTVKIECAQYDMSGITFESKEFVYDGKSHSIQIAGKLPEGVSAPVYLMNERETSSATDVGEYKVIAKFTNSDPNYEAIPDMEATLKITPAEYVIKNVDVVFKTDIGKTIDGAVKIYDGKSVTFDLDDYSKLSKKISVSFSVCDMEGKVISTSNKITNIVDAGIYTVKVEFTLADGKNYKPIQPLVRTFEILRTEHPPLENIRFGSAQVMYSANGHSIAIEGTLPEGVTVSYEYYRNGTLVRDGEGNPAQSVVDVGVYTVKAVFTHTDGNFDKIADLSATLNITRKDVDISRVGFLGARSIQYSGKSYVPVLTTWKESNLTTYDILEYGTVIYYMFDSVSGTFVEMANGEFPTEVGLYRFAIDVSIAEEYKDNYILSGGESVYTIVSSQFEITKKAIDIPSITVSSASRLEYMEGGQRILYTHNADETIIRVSAVYYKYVLGEYIEVANNGLPSDVGTYKCIITATIIDTAHQFFTNGAESTDYTFEFEIYPKTINVDGLVFDDAQLYYNGDNQHPAFTNLPEHVTISVKYYSSNGTVLLDQAIVPGEYSCIVKLTPESANYVLSGNTTYSTQYTIEKVIIDLDLVFVDGAKYAYTGSDLTNYPYESGIDAETRSVLYYYAGVVCVESGDVWMEVDRVLPRGYYKVQYWVSANNNDENVILMYKGNSFVGILEHEFYVE